METIRTEKGKGSKDDRWVLTKRDWRRNKNKRKGQKSIQQEEEREREMSVLDSSHVIVMLYQWCADL